MWRLVRTTGNCLTQPSHKILNADLTRNQRGVATYLPIYTIYVPVGALSKTLRSYFPSSPQRYLHLFPQSHWTITTDPPPCPTSTTVPTWPSPPSWSPHDQFGPRTIRKLSENSILVEHAQSARPAGNSHNSAPAHPWKNDLFCAVSITLLMAQTPWPLNKRQCFSYIINYVHDFPIPNLTCWY